MQDSEVSRALIAPYFECLGLKVAVGDRTTQRLHELSFSPDLEIVDSLEKREKREAPAMLNSEVRQVVYTTNPPGGITKSALEKIALCLKLLSGSNTKIRLAVQGEEDLLALPIIAFFPENTVTFYGQPNVGLVIVNTLKSKIRSRRVLSEMGIESLPSEDHS